MTTHRIVGIVGGAERVLCNMANALSDRNYRITILCCDEKKGMPFFKLNSDVSFINTFSSKPILSTQFFRNLRSFSLNTEKKLAKRKFLECKWKARSLAPALCKLISSVDLFIAFDFDSAFILKSLLKIDKPIIATCQTAPSLSITSEKCSLFLDSLDKCSAFHVLMPEYIEECRTKLKTVDIVHIPNIAPQYNTSSSLTSKKIICVSRYDPQKRPELLVESFALLADEFPDWKVEFWGRFNESRTPKIRNLIKKANLQERFLLCGSTDHIADQLRHASIFALPSLFEGFSLALAEGMSMGLPAVGCTDCPCVNTLIKDNSNGFLTPPTPKGYAHALKLLMLDLEKRKELGKQAKIDMKKYSAEKVWDSWERLILSKIEMHM